MIRRLDSATSCQSRVAEEASASLNISLMRCPVAIPQTQMSLVWHSRTQDSAPHAWFRTIVQQTGMMTSRGRTVRIHELNLCPFQS